MKNLLKKITPSLIWSFLKRRKRILILGLRRSLEVFGYNIARKNDYYSPLPVVSRLKRDVERWYKPSRLAGIEYDVDEFKETLFKLLSDYYAEFSQIPAYSEVIKMGFGPGYTALDALTLYMMVRDRKPRRYLEVGSGVSTYYCSLAAKENENEGYPLQIECIEPYPYESLYKMPGIKIYAKEVQDIDVELFCGLQENDVLFIDSSHILKVDGDVPFLYLEVLPNLNNGVVIHIHDIPLPYNIPYPPEFWVFAQNWPMFWNEAMVLQAFLCFNDKFRIIMSTPLLRYFDEGFLQQNVPIYESIEQNPNTFSTIWLQKVE